MVIDFEGRIDDVPFDGGKGEDVRLELGSGAFVPGFEEQLVGVKAGEPTDVAISFPDDYGNADLAGKEAVFDVEIKELLESVTPTIDDDFARNAGAADLAALREDLRARIEDQYADVARDRVKRSLFGWSKKERSLPECFVCCVRS